MDAKISRELDWLEAAIDEFAETSIRGGEYWRASYTDEDRAAVEMLTGWYTERGFKVYTDEVGNLYGRLEGKESGVILTGSHRDTVKHDGKYGGALGLLSAVAAVTGLHQELGQPVKTVEIVATVEEEGSRFISSYTGSRAIAGKLKPEHLEEEDAQGITLKQAMEDAGYYKGSLPEPRKDIERFVELSAEQGSVMEKSLKKVGLVQSIVGLEVGSITIHGEQNHAGTTPMSMRKDPVPYAAEIIASLTKWANSRNDRVVVTFGNIQVQPGKPNIIADSVTITFDIRSTNESLLSEARSILQEFRNSAGPGFSVDYKIAAYDAPADMDLDGILAMRDIAAEHNMKYMRIDSGAGHDAQIVADCLPTNMIFVPSEKGIAHSPLEYTSREDLEEGYILLREYLRTLAWGK